MIAIYASLAFFIAIGLTFYLQHPGSRLRILDYPNDRSLHSAPIPRTGGLAIAAGVYCTSLLIVGLLPIDFTFLLIAAAGLLVAVVSFADDRMGVSPLIRILVHAVAAMMLIFGDVVFDELAIPGFATPLPTLAGSILTLVFVVWMVNLYNFMDGMDGFAGGMAVIGFLTFALFGIRSGHELFSALSFALAAAAGGFLVFNLPPARIFMGDTGSSLLGFFAAALTIWGNRADIVPLWAAIVVFSPFFVDATVTLVQRVSRRERLWQAHKRHYYQRLVQLGWGHKRTLSWELVLMAGCAASAFWAATQTPRIQWFILLFWMICYPILIATVIRLERARKTGRRSPRK